MNAMERGRDGGGRAIAEETPVAWLVPFSRTKPYISHLQDPPSKDFQSYRKGTCVLLHYRIVVQSG